MNSGAIVWLIGNLSQFCCFTATGPTIGANASDWDTSNNIARRLGIMRVVGQDILIASKDRNIHDALEREFALK
jgi:hypothetical protein